MGAVAVVTSPKNNRNMSSEEQTMAQRITDETIGGLLDEGKLTPAEFGLTALEVRRYGACHPSDSSPCEHTDDTCLMAMSVYRADGNDSSGPHCDSTCPNLWDVSGVTEGIGGEYEPGMTFSYLTDDQDLCERVYRRAHAVLASA